MAINVHAYPPVSISKPPQGIDFLAYGTLTGASGAAFQTVLSTTGAVQVPNGRHGYVRSLVLQVLNVLATTDVVFQLRVNGAGVNGWAAIPVLPGVFTVWSESWGADELYVDIPAGMNVDVVVGVNDGGSYQLSAQLHGWHVPEAMAEASAAGWGV